MLGADGDKETVQASIAPSTTATSSRIQLLDRGRIRCHCIYIRSTCTIRARATSKGATVWFSWRTPTLWPYRSERPIFETDLNAMVRVCQRSIDLPTFLGANRMRDAPRRPPISKALFLLYARHCVTLARHRSSRFSGLHVTLLPARRWC